MFENRNVARTNIALKFLLSMQKAHQKHCYKNIYKKDSEKPLRRGGKSK